VAIEDQWLGPNFQGVKALIAHRGALAGVAALFGYQVEVVNTGSWQSRIGARRGTRRDAIKRLSLAFARRVTGLEFDTQDEADAACIAITTWDTARRGRMAGAGRK
jgi:Holliday junction resolvasome RuvABC endonuclease subunit